MQTTIKCPNCGWHDVRPIEDPDPEGTAVNPNCKCMKCGHKFRWEIYEY